MNNEDTNTGTTSETSSFSIDSWLNDQDEDSNCNVCCYSSHIFYFYMRLPVPRVDKSKSVELLVTAVDWNASSLIVIRTNELLQCYVSTTYQKPHMPIVRLHTEPGQLT